MVERKRIEPSTFALRMQADPSNEAAARELPSAYSGDREQQIHAMVNSAWRRRLEGWFLRQVFTIRQWMVGVFRISLLVKGDAV